nr:hypothetical protein [Tanacetum cinerariifolium]
MSSLFADTHNMVAILEKSDATKGFEQIIDFLSGCYIHYALTVNPYIYISCIKQFWNIASVKRSDDVTRLQVLVDKKKIVISEDVIREILQLDDAQGVVCLPNEEIFAGLAQMGYEKPSTKLTFYKAFFSSQWKFLIHTLLQSLSSKRTSWNEFSSAMASAVICLSTGQKFNFSKYIFDSLVRNVDSSLKFYMYPQFIQLINQNQIGDLSTHTTRYISPALTQKVFANMRRVGKGFSGVETPLFTGMLAAREIAEEGIAEEQVQVDNAVAAAVQETVAEDVANEAIPSTLLILPSPPSHEQSSPPQQPQSSPQALPQGAEFPTHLFQQVLDTCSALTQRVESLEHDKAAQKLAIIKLQARVKRLERANTVKSSKLRRLKKVGTSQRIESSVDMKDVFNQGRMIDNLDKDEGIELVVDQDKGKEINKGIDWDVVIDHVNQKSMRNQYIKRYHGMKKRPQTESEARKNMMTYLKNTDGYKLDFFNGMSYDEIRPIFQASQSSGHGQALVTWWKLLTSCGVHIISLTTIKFILLVERRYPLLKFTLDQLVNVTKLQVEEESEMSLELLRDQGKPLRVLMLPMKDNTAAKELMLPSFNDAFGDANVVNVDKHDSKSPPASYRLHGEPLLIRNSLTYDPAHSRISIASQPVLAIPIPQMPFLLICHSFHQLNTIVDRNSYVLMGPTNIWTTREPLNLLNASFRDTNSDLFQNKSNSTCYQQKRNHTNSDFFQNKSTSTCYQHTRNHTHVQQPQVNHHLQRLSINHKPVTISNPMVQALPNSDLKQPSIIATIRRCRTSHTQPIHLQDLNEQEPMSSSSCVNYCQVEAYLKSHRVRAATDVVVLQASFNSREPTTFIYEVGLNGESMNLATPMGIFQGSNSLWRTNPKMANIKKKMTKKEIVALMKAGREDTRKYNSKSRYQTEKDWWVEHPTGGIQEGNALATKRLKIQKRKR